MPLTIIRTFISLHRKLTGCAVHDSTAEPHANIVVFRIDLSRLKAPNIDEIGARARYPRRKITTIG
jgi:hypothetical protein